MQSACAVFYCHLWPVRLYYIFPHDLKKVRFSKKKKILNTSYFFLFSLQLLSKTFLIVSRNERDMTKNVYWSACNVGRFHPSTGHEGP